MTRSRVAGLLSVLLLSQTVVVPESHGYDFCNASADNQELCAAIILGLSFGSTWATREISSSEDEDEKTEARKVERLVDEAYRGAGEQVELIATETGREVAEVCEVIVELDRASELSRHSFKSAVAQVGSALAE